MLKTKDVGLRCSKHNTKKKNACCHNRRHESWTTNAWASISEELISRFFKKCSISNALDGTEDDFLWEEISEKGDSEDSASETDND